MNKSFIWTRIVEPIINSLTDDAIDKLKNGFTDIKNDNFKNNFLAKVEESILNTYGDEPFYNELSRLLNRLHIHEQIYDRCYNIQSNDFRTSDDFILSIVKKSDSLSINKAQLHDAIKYILDTTFYVLNMAEYDDTRIIINEVRLLRNQNTKEHKDLLDEIKSLKGDTQRTVPHNTFYEEGVYTKIKHLIDGFYLEDANSEISKALEGKDSLSDEQKEELYYQRARININAAKYENLEGIKKQLSSIKKDSKYISEINYHIACHNKDINLYTESINDLESHNYTKLEILEKKINYFLNVNEIERANELFEEARLSEKTIQNSSALLFSLGQIDLFHGSLDDAHKNFAAAYELRNRAVYGYNALLCKYYIWQCNAESDIVESKGNASSLASQFEEYKYFTQYFDDENLCNYWTFLINLTSLFNREKSYNLLSEIPDKIKNTPIINSVILHVLVRNEKFEEALIIAEEIDNKNEGNVTNKLLVYIRLEKWSSAISIYNNLEDKNIKNEPLIKTLFLKATAQIDCYDNVKPSLVSLLKDTDNDLTVIWNIFVLTLENNDDSFLSEILSLLNSMNTPDYYNEDISHQLNKHSKHRQCCNFINIRVGNTEKICAFFSNSYFMISNIDIDFEELVYKNIKTAYASGSRIKPFLMLKAMLEQSLKKYRESINTLLEYKKLFGVDEQYAYHYLFSKTYYGDLSNIIDEIHVLEQSSVPDYKQAAAIALADSGDLEKAKKLMLVSLYESHGNLSESILANYLKMFLSHHDKETDDAELLKVRGNTVVFLKSEKSSKVIAIHNDISIVKTEGEHKFNCENYSHNSSVSLALIAKGEKSKTITINNEEYLINDILDIYSYFNRFAMSKLQSDFPDNTHFIAIKGKTIEELIENMRKMLIESNKEIQKLIDAYNFKGQIGLPLSIISGLNIVQYYKTVMGFLHEENQNCFAGELSFFDKNKKYVLSLNTLILIFNYNLQDKLRNILDCCYITSSCKKEIKQAVKDIQSTISRTKAHVNLNCEGNVIFTEYGEKSKEYVQDLWLNLLSLSEEMNCLEVNIQTNDLYDLLSGKVLNSDIENIEECKQTEKIFVCDDLFMRKVFYSVTKTDNTTNFLGFLLSNGQLTHNELIDLTLQLSKDGYVSCVNEEVLLNLLLVVLAIKDPDFRQKEFQKLKQIFTNILSTASKDFYIQITNNFSLLAIERNVPIKLVYDLAIEPISDKSFEEMLKDAKDKVFSGLLDKSE